MLILEMFVYPRYFIKLVLWAAGGAPPRSRCSASPVRTTSWAPAGRRGAAGGIQTHGVIMNWIFFLFIFLFSGSHFVDNWIYIQCTVYTGLSITSTKHSIQGWCKYSYWFSVFCFRICYCSSDLCNASPVALAPPSLAAATLAAVITIFL